MDPIIKFEDLTISYHPIAEEAVPLIHGISSQFSQNKITGIIGESGSGKSLTMKAVLDLLPERIQASFSQFQFKGKEIKKNRLKLPISMIFQDALSSLDPLRTVRFHLKEVIQRHSPEVKGADLEKLMIQSLDDVGIDRPAQRLNQYPHEMSGGMNQRINIAMALLTNPEVLIADEPTTALDVTTQKQILDLLVQKTQEQDLSVIFVTHDLGVVAEICHEVKVMYDGLILEEAPTQSFFQDPQHPYSKELIKAMPFGKNRERLYTMGDFELSEAEKKQGRLVQVSNNHKVLEVV